MMRLLKFALSPPKTIFAAPFCLETELWQAWDLALASRESRKEMAQAVHAGKCHQSAQAKPAKKAKTKAVDEE